MEVTKTRYYAVNGFGRHQMFGASDEDAVTKAEKHNGLIKQRLNPHAAERSYIKRVDRETVLTLKDFEKP